MEPTSFDADDGDRARPSVRPRAKSNRVAWTLFSLLLGLLLIGAGGAAAFVYLRYLPEREAASAERKLLAETAARCRALELNLERTSKGLDGARAERDRLDSERTKAVQDKQAALSELERLKTELASTLQGELASGDIGIERRGQRLVVDVADKVLFETGAADISDRGKEVLEKVAAALAKRTDQMVEVGGHTDSAAIVSPETRERFPTNWELSTARATNVVRFLQDSGHIAGQRLIAAGFAQYRPAVSNASQTGRARNRRIEVALLPRASTED